MPSCARLHDLDATAAAERLPHAFHAVVPQLTADLEGVRFAAEEALKRLIAACLDGAAVAAAVNLASAGMGASAGPPSAAAGVVASIAGALDPRTQDAWPSALSGAAPSPIHFLNTLPSHAWSLPPPNLPGFENHIAVTLSEAIINSEAIKSVVMKIPVQ